MNESNQRQGRWIALEERAIIRLTGSDRVRFLNGQVTNDVSGPLDREAVAACLCTIKGRVEALVWVSATEDSLLIDGELAQRDFLLARLSRYLIADDCEICDETENILLIHHFFPEAGGVASLRLHSQGRDLFLGRGESIPFEENQEITKEEWEELSILSRIPQAGFEITGNEFPAELGLDARAVDFHKGCYLGQEVISRIQSVGRVKRRLRTICTEKPVLQGVAVENTLGENGLATRDSRPSENFFFLSMALFGASSTFAADLKNEPVPSRMAS